MELTIVIPVKNRARIVERTLESVEKQTYRPLSVVLVDNGSTDGTREVLEGWALKVRASDFNVRILDCSAPGAASARNAGLEKVDTDWTMFFDSDDEMMPGHVARAMACAQRHPEAGVIGWDVDMELASGKTKRGCFFSSDMLYCNILHGGFATQRYMARTEIFRRAGGWNPDVLSWNDIELGNRILALSPAPLIFKVNGRPTVKTHFTQESITGKPWGEKAESLCAYIDIMEVSLPKGQKWIAGLKRGQLARVCRKQGYAESARLAISKISGPLMCRALCRLAAYLPTDLIRPLF